VQYVVAVVFRHPPAGTQVAKREDQVETPNAGTTRIGDPGNLPDLPLSNAAGSGQPPAPTDPTDAQSPPLPTDNSQLLALVVRNPEIKRANGSTISVTNVTRDDKVQVVGTMANDTSQHLKTVELQMTIKDCSWLSSNCRVVAQENQYAFADIPPGQSRAVSTPTFQFKGLVDYEFSSRRVLSVSLISADSVELEQRRVEEEQRQEAAIEEQQRQAQAREEEASGHLLAALPALSGLCLQLRREPCPCMSLHMHAIPMCQIRVKGCCVDRLNPPT
jgi:hypothetical protein